MRSILESFTFEEFVNMSNNWLKSGRLVWYVSGNFKSESAINIAEEVRKTLNLEP